RSWQIIQGAQAEEFQKPGCRTVKNLARAGLGALYDHDQAAADELAQQRTGFGAPQTVDFLLAGRLAISNQGEDVEGHSGQSGLAHSAIQLFDHASEARPQGEDMPLALGNDGIGPALIAIGTIEGIDGLEELARLKTAYDLAGVDGIEWRPTNEQQCFNNT